MPGSRISSIPYYYDLREVSCDQRVPQTSTVQGFCPILDGIDGRFNGSLRTFPGLDLIHALGDVATGAYDVYDCTYIQGVSVNVGTEKVWSGYVARVQYTEDGGYASSDVKIVFEYYDGTQWKTVDIEDTADTNGDDDVALRNDNIQALAIGRLLYVFRESREPILVYFDSTETPTVITDTGPGPKPGAPNKGFLRNEIFYNVLPVKPAGADDNWMDGPDAQPLDAGQYNIAYQFYDTVSGRYSVISEFFTLTDTPIADAGDDDGNLIGRFPQSTNIVAFNVDLGPDGEGIYDASGNFLGRYDRIRVFRSVKAEDVGGIRQSAIVHLEGEYPIDETAYELYIASVGPEGSPTAVRRFRKYFTLPDLALTIQEYYDNSTAILENMPQTSAAGVLGGTLFVSNRVQGGNDPDNIAEIRWSSAIANSPELFPVFQKYTVGEPNRAPIAFSRAGDFLIGASKSNIYFIVKAGTQVDVRSAMEGYGIVNNKAITSAGDSCYALTPEGIIEINSQAQLSPVQVFDGVLKGTDLSNYEATYDPTTASIWFIDTTNYFAKVLWLNTAKASTMSGIAARAVGQGYDPELDDARLRAVFAYKNGHIYKIRTIRDKTKGFIETDQGLGTPYDTAAIWSTTSFKNSGSLTVDGLGVSVREARKLVGLPIGQIAATNNNNLAAFGIITDVTFSLDFGDGSLTSGDLTLQISSLNVDEEGGGQLSISNPADRWLMNAMLFRVRGWPAPTFSEGQPNTPTQWPDAYTVRTVNNLGMVFDNTDTDSTISGQETNVATYFARAYINDNNTPLVTNFYQDDDGVRQQIVDGPPAYHTPLNLSGALVMPEIVLFVAYHVFDTYGFRITMDVQPEAY